MFISYSWYTIPKPIDNKPSHWVLPPGHWRLKLKICRLYHANLCKFDAEIKSYKDGKTIWIYHNHYLPCTYNSKRCRYVRRHISVALDMRTLLDRKNISSRTNGRVAARRVTGLIIKRLTIYIKINGFNGANGCSKMINENVNTCQQKSMLGLSNRTPSTKRLCVRVQSQCFGSCYINLSGCQVRWAVLC